MNVWAPWSLKGIVPAYGLGCLRDPQSRAVGRGSPFTKERCGRRVRQCLGGPVGDPLGVLCLRRVGQRVRTWLRADPENIDHIGHLLTPDDPPGRLVRHLDQDYPAVRPVTQALAADLARVTAQPFQHALDSLAILAAVFAQCTIGLQGTWDKRPGLVLVQPEAYPRRFGHEASRSISSPSKSPESR